MYINPYFLIKKKYKVAKPNLHPSTFAYIRENIVTQPNVHPSIFPNKRKSIKLHSVVHPYVFPNFRKIQNGTA